MEDAFRHREHWLEEEYFRQREEELIRKIHRRRELQEATHLTDEEILDDLEQMGYTRETVKYLLPLVPPASGRLVRRRRHPAPARADSQARSTARRRAGFCFLQTVDRMACPAALG
jgi:hypothetical protein